MREIIIKEFKAFQIQLTDTNALECFGNLLVNPLCRSMLFGNTQFNKDLFKMAGNPMMLEVIKKNRLSSLTNMLTFGHSLQFSKVYHLRLPNYINGMFREKKSLYDSLEECMKVAKNNMLNIVVFPNMNTGERKFPEDEFIDTFLEAITKNSWEGLKVTICIDSDELYQKYTDKISAL